MKLIYLMLCAVLTASLLSAQPTSIQPRSTPVTISGKLIGYDAVKDKELELRLTSIIPSTSPKSKATIRPEPDGSFSFAPEPAFHYQQIWLYIGDYYSSNFLLEEGLHLEVDLDQLRDEPERARYTSEYVRLSGSSEEKWKQKVAELGIAAPQIYLSPALSKSIMSYFELKGYPSHIFIDRDGKYYPDLIHSLRGVDLETVREKM